VAARRYLHAPCDRPQRSDQGHLSLRELRVDPIGGRRWPDHLRPLGLRGPGQHAVHGPLVHAPRWHERESRLRELHPRAPLCVRGASGARLRQTALHRFRPSLHHRRELGAARSARGRRWDGAPHAGDPGGLLPRDRGMAEDLLRESLAPLRDLLAHRVERCAARRPGGFEPHKRHGHLRGGYSRQSRADLPRPRVDEHVSHPPASAPRAPGPRLIHPAGGGRGRELPAPGCLPGADGGGARLGESPARGGGAA